MSSRLVTLRAAIAAAINTAKTNGDYAYNNFTVIETYLPKAAKIELATGKLYVVGMASSEELSGRCNFLEEIPIHIGFQVVPEDFNDIATLDTLTELSEQIKGTVRDKFDTDAGFYSWMRNLPLTDPSGQPVHFASLEEGTYQTYFTAYYKTLQSK